MSRSLRADARARWFTFGCDRAARHLRHGCRVHAGGQTRSRRGGKGGNGRASARRCRARTTSSTRWRTSPSPGFAASPRRRFSSGLETFEGIKRRMEVRGVERGVTVIDDFAHHPTAIATTLAGAHRALSRAAHLGALRAALDLVEPQRTRARIHRGVPSGGPRHHRARLSQGALRDAVRHSTR